MTGAGMLGSLTVLLTAKTVGMDAAVAQVNNLRKSTSLAMSGMNSELAGFGRSLTLYGTVPITMLGVAATKTFSDFEYDIAKITGLVGIATEQTKAWSEEILNMSSSVAKGPGELADALYYITSSGFKGAESMDILKMSAEAASAGLGDTKNVADIVTSAMNAYGKANISAANATDVLTMTVREGKGEPEDLVRAFAQVIPIAAKLNVSFDEVGGAIASMTRLGLSSANASTYLRQMLFTLIKPSKQTQEALAAMGTSAGELRDSLRENGLLETLMKLKDMTEQYGESLMGKAFPNIRAFMGVTALLGANLGDVQEVFANTKNSSDATANALAAVANTWKFQFNQAVAEGKVLLIRFGEAIAKNLIPTLQGLISFFKNVGEWFSGLSDGTQRFIVQLGLIVAAVGPVLIIFNALRGAYLALVVAGTKLYSVLVMVTEFMVANPWIAAATAVLLLAQATIKYYNSVNAATQAQKDMYVIQNKAQGAARLEREEIERLVRTVQSSNSTLKMKEDALDRLNKINPKYLKGITEETLKTGEAKKAIDLYLVSLERKARIQAATELRTEEEKKYIQAVMDGADAQITSGQILLANVKALGSRKRINAIFDKMSADNAKKFQEDHIKRMEFLNGVIEDQAGIQEDLALTYTNLSNESKKYTVEYAKENQNNLKEHLNNLQLQMASEADFTDALETQFRQRIAEDEYAVNLRNKINNAANDVLKSAWSKQYVTYVAIQKAQTEQQIKESKKRYDAAQNDYTKLSKLYTDLDVKGNNINIDIEGKEKITEFFDDLSQKLNVLRINVNESFNGIFNSSAIKNAKIFESLSELKKELDDAMQKIKETKEISISDDRVIALQKERNEITMLTATYKLLTDNIQDQTNKFNSYFKSIRKPIVTEFTKGMQELDVLIKNQGDSFNATAAKVDIYKKEIDRLEKSIKVWTEAEKQQYNQMKLTYNALKMQEALEDMRIKLDDIQIKNNLLGNSFESLDERIGVYKNALRALMSIDLTGFTEDMINEWVNAVNTLSEQIDKLEVNKKILESIANGVGDIFVALGESLGNSLAEIKHSFDALLLAVLDVAISIGKQLIALGAIMLLSKKTFAKGVKYIAAGTAIVTIGTYASTKAQQRMDARDEAEDKAAKALEKIKGNQRAMVNVPRMAYGGIVPSGYSNDRYPALLSSGEHVIPPKKLPSFERQEMEVNVIIEPKTKGTDLYWIVKEVERRAKNTF